MWTVPWNRWKVDPDGPSYISDNNLFYLNIEMSIFSSSLGLSQKCSLPTPINEKYVVVCFEKEKPHCCWNHDTFFVDNIYSMETQLYFYFGNVLLLHQILQ